MDPQTADKYPKANEQAIWYDKMSRRMFGNFMGLVVVSVVFSVGLGVMICRQGYVYHMSIGDGQTFSMISSLFGASIVSMGLSALLILLWLMGFYSPVRNILAGRPSIPVEQFVVGEAAERLFRIRDTVAGLSISADIEVAEAALASRVALLREAYDVRLNEFFEKIEHLEDASCAEELNSATVKLFRAVDKSRKTLRRADKLGRAETLLWHDLLLGSILADLSGSTVGAPIVTVS